MVVNGPALPIELKESGGWVFINLGSLTFSQSYLCKTGHEHEVGICVPRLLSMCDTQ